jgi:hypothetical protein
MAGPAWHSSRPKGIRRTPRDQAFSELRTIRCSEENLEGHARRGGERTVRSDRGRRLMTSLPPEEMPRPSESYARWATSGHDVKYRSVLEKP